VVDGDTIKVRLDGQTVTIRLIGVDSPETVDPSSPVECFGPAASDFVERELLDETVALEWDAQRLDRYDRTLAYVWLGEVLFNARLLHEGYAQLLTIPPNVMYVERFRAAEQRARDQNLGLWGKCRLDEEGSPVPRCDPSYTGICLPPPPPDLDCGDIDAEDIEVVGADPHGLDGDDDGIGCESGNDGGGGGGSGGSGGSGGGSGGGGGGGGNCDPSYPGVCIPPYPPDVDCGDIPYEDFTVLPPDPHGFDGDGDGIGCES
jgi:micrococcal nuclease